MLPWRVLPLHVKWGASKGVILYVTAQAKSMV